MSDPSAPRWQPLSAHERRVLGVLVEKAKTTPEQYPLSLNGLKSGCNQKSNRYPLMELEEHQIEVALERLRTLGAAAEVQGSGRVPRFRHHAYEWLGVDKVEAAVMCELLLRGAQTEGELRGRAARMEPLADLAALRPVLASLKQKALVVSLTSEGRGHVLTHALYRPEEMDKVRAQVAREHGASAAEASGEFDVESAPARKLMATAPSGAARPAGDEPAVAVADEAEALRRELAAVKAEVADLSAALQAVREELENLKSSLGV